MTRHFGYTNLLAVSGLFGLAVILFFLAPELASAQTTFKSIVDIPGITEEEGVTENFGIYINALYIFAITAGAMLAVLKLVAAGVKYMFSDIVTNKQDAKNDIKGAILGLLIVIGAVVILNTINTNLTVVDLNFEPVNVDSNNHLQNALSRLQNRVAACEEDQNCRMESCNVAIISESCQSWCEAKNNGEWYPSAFFGGTCFYELEDETQDRCADGGGCVERNCEALGEYMWNIILSGLAAGAAVYAVSVILTGGLSLLWTLVVGGALGLAGYFGANQAECTAACYWLEGTMENNICLIPNDLEAANQARAVRLAETFEERCEREGGTFDEEINNCIRDGDNVQRLDLDIMCLNPLNPNGCVAENGNDNPLGVAAAEATCEVRSEGLGLLTVTSPTTGVCYWLQEE